MSVNLGSQIRDYAQEVDAAWEPMSLDEITERRLSTEPVRPLGPLTRPAKVQSRRSWLVAAAAAATVLVLVGGAAWLFGGTGSETPVATTPPTAPPTSLTTPPTAPPTSLTTPPTAPLSSNTWSRVAHDEAVFGGEGNQEMSSVTVGGPGLVAVGWDGSSAAVWTSTDGLTWSRVPHDEAVFGGVGNQEMSSVTVGGPGLVAIGWDEGDGSADDDLLDHKRTALWVSVDGLSWSRVSPDEDVLEGGGSGEVTAGGPGLVAVGEADRRALVWTSVDGLSWSRVPHDEAVFGLILGDGNAMSGVVAGGPGLVAVGSDGLNSDAPTGRARAVVWTSVDGLSWSRLAHDEAVFGGEGDQGMFDVTVGGPGLVAVGEDDQGAPVWTSADGITWARVPRDEAVFGGEDVRIFGVTVGGPGLLAFGTDARDAVVWTSADGIIWSRMPRGETVFTRWDAQEPRVVRGMSSVTVGGSGLVAVGSDGSDAAVWVLTTRN